MANLKIELVKSTIGALKDQQATIDGLSQLRTAEQIAKLRGKSVDEILS